jgi:hypothetical protein
MFMMSWQLIFSQSKVNNGPYNGDLLPSQVWDWPERTWFQERLQQLRREQRRFFESTAEEFNRKEVTHEVRALH